mmetsp:Transcript_30103/g.68133  ORF Transcript_30103/g.68133 Transcript_30103/m.68133 type:complete len:124 (-) Transcript_30103:618-989(-)
MQRRLPRALPLPPAPSGQPRIKQVHATWLMLMSAKEGKKFPCSKETVPSVCSGVPLEDARWDRAVQLVSLLDLTKKDRRTFRIGSSISLCSPCSSSAKEALILPSSWWMNPSPCSTTRCITCR